jgi:hypothetical protein
LVPGSLSLHGAFRKPHKDDPDIVPHSFRYSCRSGVDSTVLRNWRLPKGETPKPLDVFCFVKAFMADAEDSQPPLLVLPESRLNETRRLFHQLASADCPVVPRFFEEARREEFALLAERLDILGVCAAGSAYLKRLAVLGLGPVTPSPLPIAYCAASPMVRHERLLAPVPFPEPLQVRSLAVTFKRPRT